MGRARKTLTEAGSRYGKADIVRDKAKKRAREPKACKDPRKRHNAKQEKMVEEGGYCQAVVGISNDGPKGARWM